MLEEAVYIIIDFGSIPLDMYGNIKPPTLILKKKSGGVIGTLGDYIGLKAQLKYNQKSSFTFEYPAYINQVKTPFYDDLVGDRIVKIDPYGVFLLDGPESRGSGYNEKKTCTCYSLEYELAEKSLVLEAGTYRFYDLSNPRSPSTIIGRILEKARNWKIGSVSKTLWSKYRTFDDTEIKIYDWMIGTLQSTYGCVFIFDTYTRTISVIDADADVEMVPVYLSYDNMIKEGTIREVKDNMFTRLSVHGASPLDIRGVNPIGSNYIYNIDYFIGLGDIPSSLAVKWGGWQALIRSRQPYYTSLVGLRTAAYGRYLAARALLSDLNGELALLDNLRSVNTQGLALASQQSVIDYYSARLAEIAVQYASKQNEIEAKQAGLDLYLAEYHAISEDITAVVNELRIDSYFTEDELGTLDHYFSEDNFADSTFAVYDVDVSGDSDSVTNIASASVSFSDISLEDVEMSGIWGCNECHRHFTHAGTPNKCPYCDSTGIYSITASGRRLFSLHGGSISISGTYQYMGEDGEAVDDSYTLSADIVNGTIDHRFDGELVCSFYLGDGNANGFGFPSGNLTISSTSNFDDNDFLGELDRITETTVDEETGISYDDIHYEGSSSFNIEGGSIYFTRNVTDSQRYYVAQELYDYAVKQLENISLPTYSFELSTINPIFAREFEPFKNVLRFGCGCYLQLRDDLLTKQMLLEIHLDYEDPSKFSMVFSNEFKRPSYTNKMKKQLEESSSAAKTLDLQRFNYGDQSGTHNVVAAMMQQGFKFVDMQIRAGKDQNVTVDRRGIKIAAVGGKEYILLADGMIAIIDENGNSKMAMGHFYNTASGQNYYGVLADVIGGNLLIGLELNITCPDVNGGIAQFKVDSTGAFLNNSRFYLQNDGGGKIGMDSNYGIFEGTAELFETTGTGHVHPSFIDANTNEVILDSDGFPINTNFWADIRTGDVYLRGKVIAESGFFRGVVQASDFQDHTGKSMLTDAGKFDSSYLDLGNIQLDGATGDIAMTGNITLDGNINLSGGNITWGNNLPIKSQFAVSETGPWHDDMLPTDKYRRDSNDGGATWGAAYQFRGTDGAPGSDADVPGYIKNTYIDATGIETFKIKTNILQVIAPDNAASASDYGFKLDGYYDGIQYNMLNIYYYPGDGPLIHFGSDAAGIISYWDYLNTNFTGDVKFYGKVSGVTAVFA